MVQKEGGRKKERKKERKEGRGIETMVGGSALASAREHGET